MKKKIALVFCLLLALSALAAPIAYGAGTETKTVRVGWYDSSYNTIDASGQRTGYAYEYQMKIASYTGWRYEYVSGSWPDLLQMLSEGKIDLMSDVSYTAERTEHMLFPTLPMGTEEYYLFISSDNREISATDPATLNGKKVGVNKDSVQSGFFQDWARQNGVRAELIEVTGTEKESLQMLHTGALDAYVTVDSFVEPERAVPAYKIGSSDFFFAVSRTRPDLLQELNFAMSKIQDENRYYNQRMFEKYIKRVGANAFLTADEVDWLAAHGTIRVGYQDNYLAFCAADKETGELTGVLKDCLAHAADRMSNAHLDFEARAYPSVAAAVAAMKNGEIDCVFPANFSSYNSEALGLAVTPPLMDTELYAVVRRADQSIFAGKGHVVAAVNEGNPNYDAVLNERFPDWRKVYYPTTDECLKAVGDGVADCILISNYRYNNLSRQCSRYHLTAIATGVEIDYCFAVSSGQTELYSILAKTVGLIPGSSVSSSFSHYITEDARLSFGEFLMEHAGVVTAVAAAVLLVILFLLVQNMRAVRTAKRLISATETDELTGLYNRDYFFEYANRMFRENAETPMDAIVLNIEQFHSVNALNGREFGDHILRTLGGEIRAVAREHDGIAGRFGADRFDIYCRHTQAHRAILDRLQGKLDALAPGGSIRLRMGVMSGQKHMEPVQIFDRARTACNMARGHYKEHLIEFDENVREREIFEQRLMSDLRGALDGYEFEVYYQPKYDIRTQPPKPVSAEALIRWRHPQFGMIHPDEFIPLLERNGRIQEVDEYVWNEAAGQIVRWREKYGLTIPVSVNLSRVDVFDPQLEMKLDRILAFHGLARDILRLEVTESAYTENASQVIQVVEHLRERGYVVEMDDFGTGYSSLNMLSAMPIDVLKMDRTFVRNMEYSERDAQLVALILGIADNLKVSAVAEGVETQRQLEMLQALGCGMAQGYYFARPLPPSDFETTVIPQMQQAQ